MAILHENSSGTFFDRRLLAHIRLKNNDEILPILKDVTDPCQLSDSFGNTLLHYAAESGNNDIAQHLIDRGAAVDAQNRRQQTPLFLAVDAGRRDTARFLVGANADMFVPDDRGQCPLGRAFTSRLYIAIALIDKVTVGSLKRNIEYVTSEKFHLDCPLYRFIPLKNADITRLLLECGSPVNAKNPLIKNTALHLAAEQLDLENVKVLLEYGADVNAKTDYRETPLARIPVETDFRRSKESDEADSKALAIVKVLLAAGATLIDREPRILRPRKLLTYGNREMVHTLIVQGAIDLEFVDNFNETVLHVLAKNKHPDILEEVTYLETVSNVRSSNGYTMLHIAAKSGNVNAIKHLLNSGADVNAVDRDVKTPLSWIYDDYWSINDNTFLDDYLYTIVILLEHGANPPSKSSSWENESFRMMLDLMKKRVAEMKQIVVEESMSLFDFFVATDEQLSSYARYKRSIMKKLAEKMEEHDFDLYYNRRLLAHYAKLSQFVETRETFELIIEKVFNKFYNTSLYTVAEKIVKYLSDGDLCRI